MEDCCVPCAPLEVALWELLFVFVPLLNGFSTLGACSSGAVSISTLLSVLVLERVNSVLLFQFRYVQLHSFP